MGLFDKIKDPVILKADSSSKQQLEELERLLINVTDKKIQAQLKNDIAAVIAGIYGEETLRINLLKLKEDYIWK